MPWFIRDVPSQCDVNPVTSPCRLPLSLPGTQSGSPDGLSEPIQCNGCSSSPSRMLNIARQRGGRRHCQFDARGRGGVTARRSAERSLYGPHRIPDYSDRSRHRDIHAAGIAVTLGPFPKTRRMLQATIRFSRSLHNVEIFGD